MRTMYDSTTPTDLPVKATLVAAYVDGKYRTVDHVRERFPKAKIVTITVLGAPGADVCDTEPGNIGPAAAARWAKNEVAAGRHPTLYCEASQWDEVKRAVAANGVTGKVSYWIAQYDGRAAVPKGAVAKQYLHGDKAHPGSYSGGHYDVSIVADYWPGVDRSRATRLTAISAYLARRITTLATRLTRRLANRDRPLSSGRGTLAALAEALQLLVHQLNRVLNLK